MSKQMDEVTQRIREAAIDAAVGIQVRDYAEPKSPSWKQQAYLSAISAFKAERHCAGYDLMDAGDAL